MENFFIQGFSINEVVEIEELLLRRYSDINYILGLDYEEGIEFIKKATEKELEDRLWERWLVDYRLMTKDTFIPFDKYLEEALNPGVGQHEVEKLPIEAIEQKVKDIIDLTL